MGFLLVVRLRRSTNVTQSPRAVVLLSGGMDSATALAVAKHEGFELYAMSFNYGQRHSVELEAARRVAQQAGVMKHVTVPLTPEVFAGSALTSDIPVPKDRDLKNEAAEIPVTYVPARNTVFLSFALAWAEVLGAADIFIGVSAIDYSGYVDCRPEYIEAFERMANLATKAAVEGQQRLTIHAPLIRLSKRETVELGLKLGVDYAATHSCYDPAPTGAACGRCDSCQLRLRAFAELGLSDPAPYAMAAG